MHYPASPHERPNQTGGGQLRFPAIRHGRLVSQGACTGNARQRLSRAQGGRVARQEHLQSAGHEGIRGHSPMEQPPGREVYQGPRRRVGGHQRQRPHIPLDVARRRHRGCRRARGFHSPRPIRPRTTQTGAPETAAPERSPHQIPVDRPTRLQALREGHAGPRHRGKMQGRHQALPPLHLRHLR